MIADRHRLPRMDARGEVEGGGGARLEMLVLHDDAEREYAYDRDPILGAGTSALYAAATEHKWTVIDMAADWAVMYPPAR